MYSNLVTPPDIVDNNLHSVLFIDIDQTDVDAVIRFCQYSDKAFNIYVYTPNMDNLEWLSRAVAACDAIIVNSNTNNYTNICLKDNCYYYGPQLYIENPRKLNDPLHYFVVQSSLAK